MPSALAAAGFRLLSQPPVLHHWLPPHSRRRPLEGREKSAPGYNRSSAGTPASCSFERRQRQRVHDGDRRRFGTSLGLSDDSDAALDGFCERYYGTASAKMIRDLYRSYYY